VVSGEVVMTGKQFIARDFTSFSKDGAYVVSLVTPSKRVGMGSTQQLGYFSTKGTHHAIAKAEANKLAVVEAKKRKLIAYSYDNQMSPSQPMRFRTGEIVDGTGKINLKANKGDVLYFKTNTDAEAVAKANNWKTPIVRYFDKGYAIQRNVSGAYFGAHNDDATAAVTKIVRDKAIAKQNKIDATRASKGLVARSKREVFGK
jgi:hypothetical protein